MIIIPPKRPEFADVERRLETFSAWPDNSLMDKETLAQAGFFYTGDADCTRCFYCGGALRNWRPADDVWIEHARHFSCCPFMEQQLGQEIINTVVELSQEHSQVTALMLRDAVIQNRQLRQDDARGSGNSGRSL